MLSKGEAKVHVNTPQDTPLPVGTTYLSEDGGCVNIIYGRGKLSNTREYGYVHGIQQPVLKYSVALGILLHGPADDINSRDVRLSLLEGRLNFVNEELFKQVENSTRLLESAEGNPLRIKRTIPYPDIPPE